MKEEKLFLLNYLEYNRNRGYIPRADSWWWLCSTDEQNPGYADVVDCSGGVDYDGMRADDVAGVRPAMEVGAGMEPGEVFMAYGTRFVYIGEGLAIAESPIGFCRYSDGGDNNDYAASYIRQWLRRWETARNSRMI